MRMRFAPAVLLLALATGSSADAQPVITRLPPPLDVPIERTTRLLVIAPHPDDEILGAGGLIRRVVLRGGSVHVIWLTSGDAFPQGVESAEGLSGKTRLEPRDFETYGDLREHEATAALGALGVPSRSLTFLGFPDEGLCDLASKYLSAKAAAFKSPYTGQISPPLTEQVIRGITYRGMDTRRELERVIRSFGPTLIVTPHPEDEHPDHCSTHIFLKEALDALSRAGGVRPRVLHYLVHYRQWPLSDGDGADGALLPPPRFPRGEGRWVSVALTRDEALGKRAALELYHSQLLVMRPFMLAFARGNELFLEGEPASLPSCWCEGENVAHTTSEARLRKPRRPSVRR